jgi:hypothetical protein
LKAAGKKKEYEMRKSLLMGGAALLVLALVLSACNDGYNLTNTNTETIPKLSDPASLKAVNEHEGVITLTWDPVYDAADYEVWRKTGDEPAVKLTAATPPNNLFAAPGGNRYDDVVSDTNVLETDTEYTYTVVAVSNKSTSRGVDVVQNGVSTTHITIPAEITPESEYAGIPARGNEGVVTPVGELKAEAAKTTSGSNVVRISWDKNENPGVLYKVEIPVQPSSPVINGFNLSEDGERVVYDYTNFNNLTDREKYKIKVTAYFAGDYYKAAAPVETVYTHSKPTNILAEDQSGDSIFEASVITLSSGEYDVSLYWMQDQKAPTDVTYELYIHEGTSFSNNVVGEPVTVTIPAADATGFIQVRPPRPAYRQAWTYKLVAKVGGEVVDSATASLVTAPWSVPSSINTNGTSSAVTVTQDGSKTIKVVVEQVTSSLYTGDTIQFYAVPYEFFNNSGITTDSDQYLAQFTPIGSGISKTALTGNAAARTVTGTVSNLGSYLVIAVFKNGDTKVVSIPLSYPSGGSQSSWGPVNVNN